ncbi:MAG: LegC family aminotransferase [Deltaproteobacteria bacterium]|nr:LegC family aminotransferase [Deltaproteobacteria bacterium]
MADVKTSRIPLCDPTLGGNEWQYVRECLDTNWVSSAGPFVHRFEQEMARYVGAQYAVAVVNGTAALHVALQVAGIRPNDEVVMPALTFIAPANAVRYCGAWPVFLDVDPQFWQMDPQRLADFLNGACRYREGGLWNKTTGRRVRGILPVHALGHPVDMDPVMELSRKYGLIVIEDATESLGAEYRGKKVGTLGDLSCLSFNGNKLITTGGGGMVLTDRREWAEKVRYLTTQAKDDPIGYVHNEIGYNYRLTNIQAAVGCAQLERIDEHIAAKRRIAARYTQAFAETAGLLCMREAPWARSVFWLFTILLDPARCGLGNRRLLDRLDAAGIQTRPLWQPLHLSPAHRGCPAYQCDEAARIADRSLSLPSSVALREEEQCRVIQAVQRLVTV